MADERPAQIDDPWALGRYWAEFRDSIRADIAQFSWEGPRVRRAVATGLASMLAVLAAIALDLDFPLWSGMTAFTVTQASAAATALKGLLRTVGTIAGALLGALFIGYVADSHTELVIALFISISYPLYRSYLSRYNYAWFLCSLTVGLVLMTTMADPDSGLRAAGYRAAEIVTGTLAAWFVSWLVLPETSEKDLALIAPPSLSSRRAAALAAIEAGIGVLLVVILYDFFDLPGFSAAAVSMTRLADPDPTVGRRRGFLRLGCIVGAAAGLAAVAISIDTLVGLSLVIFFVCAFFGYFASGSPASAYAGMQAGFAFLIAFVEGGGPALSLEPSIDRVAGVLLAAAVFWVVDETIGSTSAQT